jgi:hypothetical protein
LAVGVVLLVAGLARVVVPLHVVKTVVASMLVAFGLYRLWRHRHPVYGGMQVGFRDLIVWSFLMAWAHGAGLMVLPAVLGLPAAEVDAAGHFAHAHPEATTPSYAWPLLGALGLHTLVYLGVTAILAWVVYSRVGLVVLRTAWFNLDWLWACVLVATGVIALLV